jgi:sugar phosphate isomerase/epimerase
MKLSLVVQTPEVPRTIPVALLTGTLEEKFLKAAQWGADGVELMTTEPAKLDGDKIRSSLRANNLQISAIASGAITFALGLTLVHTDPEKVSQAKKRLIELINFAKVMQAPVVTIGSFRGQMGSVEGGGRQRLREILVEAAEYAQIRSVRLALEPTNRYENDFIVNAEQGLAFIQEINHPALGLLLDTFHINIEESSWTEPFHRVMNAGKLWHIHLGDNNRLPPGHGLIDFPAIVKTLSEIGYKGYISAELLAKPDPDTAARETLIYMRSLLE